jgi:mannose-6-phosphate isomerase-like protein (cupin superfamily)
MRLWVSPSNSANADEAPSTVTYTLGDAAERPWGSWRVVDLSERHVVKRVEVRPGSRLSNHVHKGRHEHWIIVAGTGEAVMGQRRERLEPGRALFIPIGLAHRLSNTGATDLVLVEVQTGPLLDEADIVRIQDDYGRAPAGAPRSTSP